MGIAMQVVEIATASIPESLKGCRVEKVNLKVGKLSAVVPDSLRFCFEIITQDTPLAGAKLSIEEIPVKAKCSDCGTEWIVTEPVFRCINCKNGSIKIISGQELDITSIEIEDKNDLNQVP